MLDSLKLGEEAIIKKIKTNRELKFRLNDLGIVEGAKIKALFKSPLNDPTAYLIKNTVIAIRKCDARLIEVTYE